MPGYMMLSVDGSQRMVTCLEGPRYRVGLSISMVKFPGAVGGVTSGMVALTAWLRRDGIPSESTACT